MKDLLRLTDRGLYCEAGGFYIDPWRPVERAVVTHAHSDHARAGSTHYLCAPDAERLLRARLGDVSVQTAPYGEILRLNDVSLSLHPAGHILGSAQVRVEWKGRVWVVTGDYKTDTDPTCRPFELVPCQTLVTECTFGLPIYRWPAPARVFEQINAWWRRNQSLGKTSVLFGYALGKAQRLMAGVDPTVGPMFTHGSVEKLAAVYRREGIALPPTTHVPTGAVSRDWSEALVIAPQSASGTTWMRRFGDVSTAFASGWMRIRGRRRQRSVDRGFVLSDHVDWAQLMDVVEASGAERVLATHGYSETVVRYLRERGLEADALATRFEGASDAAEYDVEAEI